MPTAPGPRLIDLGNPVATDHPLNRGLVGWWLALPHNGGGARLFDLQGRYPGTLTNGPVWAGTAGRPGALGSAVTYDGTNDVTVCTGTGGVASGAWAIACWVKLLANGSFSYVVGSNGNFKGLRSTGTTKLGICDGSTIDVQSAALGNVWSHVLGTLDGTNATFYVNGVQVGQSASAVTGLAGDLCIAARSTAAADPQNCVVDDVRLYGRSPSASEVAALYLESLARYPTALRRYVPKVWSSGGAAAGGTDTPLNAQPGSFACTGSAATLAVGLAAGTGTFSLTGSAAGLAIGLSAGVGSFAETGGAATLAVGFAAGAGGVTLSGLAATLGVGLSAGTGSATSTGSAAGFAIVLSAAPGAFALTGFAATLVATGQVATADPARVELSARDTSRVELSARDTSRVELSARRTT